MSGKKKVDVPRLSDFEISMLVIERNVSQYKTEQIDELLNKVGEAQGYFEAARPVVKEETFNILKWEEQEGTSIGKFEVAHRNQNIVDKFSHGYGILSKANAVIGSRYHGEGYEYSYWLYGNDRMYRQKLKK